MYKVTYMYDVSQALAAQNKAVTLHWLCTHACISLTSGVSEGILVLPGGELGNGSDCIEGMAGWIRGPALGMKFGGMECRGGKFSVVAAVGGRAKSGRFFSRFLSSLNGSGRSRMSEAPGGLGHGLGSSFFSLAFSTL